jgi:DNA (cytosine-5)-methyltransferase 1
MRELALFAGVGGGILGGLLLGWEPVCAVELADYQREVLLRRQRDGVLPLFPVWDDIRTFDGRPWSGLVDVVSGGFPCQPWSPAGRRRGASDERNLWPDTIRVIREVGPHFAFLENSPGLLAHDYFGTVLGELAESGFGIEWGVFSAFEAGAPILRERLWIVARADDQSDPAMRGQRPTPARQGAARRALAGGREGDAQRQVAIRGTGQGEADLPLAPDLGQLQRRRSGRAQAREGGGNMAEPWTEPMPPGVAARVAHRVERLESTGNGQVPIVARNAWRRLSHES